MFKKKSMLHDDSSTTPLSRRGGSGTPNDEEVMIGLLNGASASQSVRVKKIAI